MISYSSYDRLVLANLTDEEVQKLVEIELAYNEVVPVAPPEPLTTEDIGLRKTVQAFKVGSLVFMRLNEAELVRDLMPLKDDYDCAAGWNHKFLVPGDFNVETVFFYSQADVVKHASQLRAIEKQQEKYRAAKNEYDSFLQAAGKARDLVWDAVYTARSYQKKITTARETLASYIELSNGDETVATAFFRDTYKNQPDVLEAVLGIKQTQEDDNV
jgi:hypothetical protein